MKLILLTLCAAASLCSQALSPHWEELTAADFEKAIDAAKNTCVLPIGILEKHGPHLPIGNDLINVFQNNGYGAGRPQLHSRTDQHAGESETAHTMISRPDLVHLDRASAESGADLNRLDLPAGVYTGIWWYSKFPNHYAGNGADATTALGQFDMNVWIANIANAIRAVKADQMSPRLQKVFFDGAGQPATKR